MKKITYLFCLAATILFSASINAQQITLTKAVFSPTENIVVKFSGWSVDADGYITVVKKGTPDDKSGPETPDLNRNHKSNETAVFLPKTYGDYEARVLISANCIGGGT